MCEFKSAIVTRQGKVLHHHASQSHEDLIEFFQLRDNGTNFVRVEFVPKGRAYATLDAYELKLDETEAPPWWDEKLIKSTTKSLRLVIKNMIVTEERNILLGGYWIFGDGGIVGKVVNGTIMYMLDSSQVGEMWDSSRVVTDKRTGE